MLQVIVRRLNRKENPMHRRRLPLMYKMDMEVFGSSVWMECGSSHTKQFELLLVNP